MMIVTEKDTGVEPDLKKMMKNLGNQVPMRISDIPYTREKHHELDPAVFKRESVGSLANCAVCHITAEKGIYDDDDVKIPSDGPKIIALSRTGTCFRRRNNPVRT